MSVQSTNHRDPTSYGTFSTNPTLPPEGAKPTPQPVEPEKTEKAGVIKTAGKVVKGALSMLGIGKKKDTLLEQKE